MTIPAPSTPATRSSPQDAAPNGAPPTGTPVAPPPSIPKNGRLSFSSAKSAKSGRSIRSVLSGKSIKSPRSATTVLSDGSDERTPDGSGQDAQVGGDALGGPSAAQATPSPKPTKKSTMDELKVALEEFGLDTKGKKDTLFKRLLHAFRRAQTPSTPTQSVPPTDPTADPTRSVFDTAGPSRVNPYLNYDPSLNPRGLSPKAWGKQPCRAFLCFDVEATCRGGKEFSWPNEIIEFPVVLVKWDEEEDAEEDQDENAAAGPALAPGQASSANDGDVDGYNAEAGPSRTIGDYSTAADTARPAKKRRLKIVDTFHSYVRPVWTTELSEFCVKFTGITQDMVNAAPTFPEVLCQLEEWLDKHELRDGEGLIRAMWVTDGPWDLRDFLHITPTTPSYPLYLRQPYLNIKQAFQTVLSEEYRRKGYAADHPGVAPNARALSRITTGKLVGKDGQERLKGLGFYSTITGMLEKLELGAFEGRQHCGLDDATNVARILMALAEKDVLFEANAKLPPPNGRKKWPWMGAPGEVNWEEWMSDARTKPLATTVAPPTTGTAAPAHAAEAVVTNGGEGLGTAQAEAGSTVAGTTDTEANGSNAGSEAEPRPETEEPGKAVVALEEIKLMEEHAGPLAKPPPEDVEVVVKEMEKVAVA